MNLIDFDGIFEEKLSEYIEKNAGKYNEQQWADKIPKLYEQFGRTYIKQVGDTPVGFYAKLSDSALVEALNEHLLANVPVSDFLCSEIERRNCTQLLLPLLDREDEVAEYAVNLIGADVAAFDSYIEIVADSSRDTDLRDNICDMLKESADAISEQALAYYEQGVAPLYMLEILSRCKDRSEQIFNALTTAFYQNPTELAMHSSFLAAYGDARALPILLAKIESDEINYVEFQELKYAIEALGGTYDVQRDFSDDPYYQELQSSSSFSPVDYLKNRN